jgi:hypothetical protein
LADSDRGILTGEINIVRSSGGSSETVKRNIRIKKNLTTGMLLQFSVYVLQNYSSGAVNQTI